MRVKTITYAMLRKTSAFENDRVEFTIEVNEDDNPVQAALVAKALCTVALTAAAVSESDALELVTPDRPDQRIRFQHIELD